jgi:glycosyltransferase involved in cell wall biosynthesis
VYDFDDAVFDDPSPARRALRTGDKCRRATAAADVVIAGNDYLADWAAQHNADVRMIPSCVDPDDYRPKTDWSITGHAPSIVWLGSPSTERYVAGVTPALLQAHRQTGATLTLISGPRTNPALDQLNHMIRRVPWTLDSFAKVLAGADAAIAPLDGSKYSLGKCAYKLLQYAAAGLPMIGSPVGANELALHRFDGLVARSTDEWIGGLSELLTESCSRRAERGMTARSAVQAHYSFQAWAAAWSAATGFTGATLRASEA